MPRMPDTLLTQGLEEMVTFKVSDMKKRAYATTQIIMMKSHPALRAMIYSARVVVQDYGGDILKLKKICLLAGQKN